MIVSLSFVTIVLLFQNTAFGFHLPPAVQKTTIPSFQQPGIRIHEGLSHGMHITRSKLQPLTSLNAMPIFMPINGVSLLRTLKGGSSVMGSLYKDNFYVLSAVMILSTFGIVLERKTQIGKALSAPLATMALALIVANLGIIPFSSPVYDFVNRNLVALAIPLLLYDSNLRRVISDTGTMLLAFIVGAISTIIGTLVTYPLLPLKSLGSDSWKVASALAARHIGGTSHQFRRSKRNIEC